MSRMAAFLRQLDTAFEQISLADTAVAALELKVTELGDGAGKASALVDGIAVSVSTVQDTLAVAQANAANMDALVKGIEAGLFRADAMGVELVGNMSTLPGLFAELQTEMNKIDPRGLEQQIQEMVAEIQKGEKSFSEFVALLEKKAPEIGAQVRSLLDQFEAGEIRADQLQAKIQGLIASLNNAFKAGGAADSALGAALRELGQQAQSGELLADLRKSGQL